MTPDPNSPNGELPEREPLIPEVEPIALDSYGRVIRVPTVEILPRQGFGAFKAFLWCLLFLLLTQVVAPLALVVPYVIAEGPKIVKRLQEDGGDASIEQVLKTPEVQRMLQIAVLTGPPAGLIFSLFFIPRVVGRDWPRKLGFRLPHYEHVILIVLLSLPMLVFNMWIDTWLTKVSGGKAGDEMKAVIESMATWPAWILILGIAVGPALSEELFCRSFLGQGLVGRYGVPVGVFFTSFYFGLIHLNLLQGVVAFLIGIVLHLTYIASRSLLIPILLHFLNNFVVITGVSQDLQFPVAASLEAASEFQPELMLIAAALMAVAIAWAFRCTRVQIQMPGGMQAPPGLYPHVQVPHPHSINEAVMGPMPAVVMLSVLATSSFFGGVWLGW